MKYFTKEWYDFMRRLDYTSGLKRIPDKTYTDEEIQEFYKKGQDQMIKEYRECYDRKPSMDIYDELAPDRFLPESFLFVDEITGEPFNPETPEIAKYYLDKEMQEAWNQYYNRPAFDPLEAIQEYQRLYNTLLHQIPNYYPDWVVESVDHRLLALLRIPESAYKRLRKEELANRRAYKKFEKEALEVLRAQRIPEDIRSQFTFHDSDLLVLKRKKKDYELTMRICSGWPHNTETPYIKVIFKNVSRLDREPGIVLRYKVNQRGEYESCCRYLYDELYKTENGYEVHMMISARGQPRYITISCEDIAFVNNLTLPENGVL